MDKHAAIRILSTLAQGIHPDTGECFTEGSPYNSIEVTRALFFAVECLREGKQFSIAVSQTRSEDFQNQETVFPDRKRTTAVTGDPQDKSIELTEKQKEMFELLRKWRFEQAHTEGVAVYRVLNNDSLSRVAVRLPLTNEELALIKGFGEMKVQKYAEMILKMVMECKQTIPLCETA